ncbi:diguanylate cyclase [Rheinheimera sp.]|uniref:GGDEF domain-containing protein n=1 Tax=Rheinheimera sp. TaxID=1869214 RepID=UPI0027B93055|nr:GGDEF domain-containing protein [Rheinheimera sp.]
MDLFTLAAINLVIGLFTAIFFGIEYRRNLTQKYLLDFSLSGCCLIMHAFIAIMRDHVALPYFILPGFINTITVVIHLLILSALYRLLQVPLQRYYLVLFATLTYSVWFLPLFQQDQFSRLLIGFAIMCAVNVLCLRLLFTSTPGKFSKVVTFFQCVMFFNIAQMLLRSALFITGKYSFTAAEPNPFVHQLGWFSLTIYAALILTGGLIILARQRQLELEVRAERDPMTGLLNRYSMQDRLNAELNRCLRNHQPMALLIFDIDHFKSVNDNFGHQMGDQVIRQVAAVSQATFRNYDLVFRMGGEEFLVCLPGVNQQQAAEKAELLRQQIEAQQIVPGAKITISIGYVIAQPNQDLDSLIKQADDALYHAKENGRNRSVAWCSGEFVFNN